MPSSSIKLTRRRLLGGLTTIGGASAAAGAGTMAMFGDSEASSGNTLQTGTLDLKIDDGDQTVSFLDVFGIEPGEDYTDYQGNVDYDGAVKLSNDGSIPGRPEVEVAAIRSDENGYHGRERNRDDTPNEGELDEHLDVLATIDSYVVWDRQRIGRLSSDPYSVNTTIDPGKSRTFTLRWWLWSDVGNLVQSDSIQLDLNFRLVQTEDI